MYLPFKLPPPGVFSPFIFRLLKRGCGSLGSLSDFLGQAPSLASALCPGALLTLSVPENGQGNTFAPEFLVCPAASRSVWSDYILSVFNGLVNIWIRVLLTKHPHSAK